MLWLPVDPRMAAIRVQCPQSHRRGGRPYLLAHGHLQLLQVVLEGESCEKIAFDIEISAKVGFGKPQWISPEHRGADDLRIAKHQLEGRLLRARIGSHPYSGA